MDTEVTGPFKEKQDEHTSWSAGSVGRYPRVDRAFICRGPAMLCTQLADWATHPVFSGPAWLPGAFLRLALPVLRRFRFFASASAQICSFGQHLQL